jgi:hypothetical protein
VERISPRRRQKGNEKEGAEVAAAPTDPGEEVLTW